MILCVTNEEVIRFIGSGREIMLSTEESKTSSLNVVKGFRNCGTTVDDYLVSLNK